jgi:hypothetical protein
MDYFDATNHKLFVANSTAEEIVNKYDKGQEEHGGKLWRKPIMDYIGEEIIDMAIYWSTFKVQWKELLHIIRYLHLLTLDPQTNTTSEIKALAEKALNLMERGNVEGDEEEERAS